MSPAGAIFLIGDSHIGLNDGDELRMIDWLDRLSRLRPASLYLNGDVFHYFIGHPNFITRSVEKVFDRLGRLKQEGTAIHYIEGNRDFFVKDSQVAEALTEISTESTFLAGGKRYLVTHGDMINDRDIPYRLWRRASKNALTRRAVRFIPKGIARRFVDRVERRLAMSNFKHKTRLPVELMEAYGRSRSEQGYDTVVFGHFHHKLIVPAGKATVAVLPPWFEHGEAMVVDPGTGEYSFVIL
jgi:UDP-2,3-diacylglucosamine hydrolase